MAELYTVQWVSVMCTVMEGAESEFQWIVGFQYFKTLKLIGCVTKAYVIIMVTVTPLFVSSVISGAIWDLGASALTLKHTKKTSSLRFLHSSISDGFNMCKYLYRSQRTLELLKKYNLMLFSCSWHVWGDLCCFIYYNVHYVAFIVAYVILKWQFYIR